MLSTSTWIIICIVILIIKYVVFQPLEDKRLYKMYTARDKLAIKAIQGQVNQNSKEYGFVMDNVNFSIYYTKNDYDFFIIFRNIFKRPLEDRINFEKLLSKLKKNKYIYETYATTWCLFIRSLNLRVKFFVFCVLRPISFILDKTMYIKEVIEKILNLAKRSDGMIEYFQKMTKTISKDYKEYQKEKPYCM